MIRNIFLFILGSYFLSFPSFSQVDSAQKESNQDVQVLLKFLDHLKKGEKSQAADLIRYPLARHKPLPPIKDKNDFLEHYDEFFNSEVLAEIEKGKSDVGSSWRGTSIAAGILFAGEGKVFAINTFTQAEHRQIEKVWERARLQVHPSVRDFSVLAFECLSKKFHVQIQISEGQGLRYVSWKRGSTENKPELILPGGVSESQGSGGGAIYRFKRGAFTYEVHKVGVCGEVCDSSLLVLKSGKKVLEEVCVEKL